MASDFIEYKIHGDNMQILEIDLDPGESVLAETGAMAMMSEGIDMNVSTGGSLWTALKSKFVGEGFFVSRFTANGKEKKARVGFAAPYPGHIHVVNLVDHRGAFICQKNSFIACANGISLNIHLQKKLGAGLFGGHGFVLQKLEGVGLAFIHAGGNFLEIDLAPGETMRCDTGCVLGYTHGMKFDIDYVGGFLNPLFGDEGVFLASITGPGKLLIQSLPFQRIVDAISTGLTHSGGRWKKVK